MKKIKYALAALLMLLCGMSFGQNKYQYTVDLSNPVDDKVKVTLICPSITQDEIEFQMPKIVPGTYAISDFGRFVKDLEASDAKGTPLAVDFIDENRWLIHDAKSLKNISYWVEDTWDFVGKPKIFEPGGTNIEAGKNFVLNNFGFFGYLEDKKEMPFQLKVIKPNGFYGSTPLVAKSTSATEDVFEVEDYHRLVDSPIMYCLPDTAWRNVGGAKVLVSVYSPNKKVSAKAIMVDISEIMEAQKEYLGGKLPVEKYAFIVYLTDRVGGSGGMGALEHSYSSLYYMPETEESAAGAMMRDVAAHEFFHIVTPLSIHSEEIQYFDYINPKMSQHLWLYEGLTEYAASHVQVKQGLIRKDQYFRILSQKITMANFMLDTVPFTEISKGCLDEYKSQYLNVYQKGALIGMCLDIQLRKLSDGKMGTQELMRELAKSYGKDKAFKDDELFDKIVELTYPEIGTFFKRYVAGPEILPYEEILAMAGLKFEIVANRDILSMGRISMDVNPETNRLRIMNVDRANKFGEKMGYKDGDELVMFDGVKVTAENSDDVIAKYQANHKAGDKIRVVVARPDGKGGYAEKKLKAKAITAKLRGMNVITIDPNASAAQLALRKSWIGS